MAERKRSLPLLVTGLVVLAALAAAAWLAFFAPPASVREQPTVPAPEEVDPVPMMKPAPEATPPAS